MEWAKRRKISGGQWCAGRRRNARDANAITRHIREGRVSQDLAAVAGGRSEDFAGWCGNRKKLV